MIVNMSIGLGNQMWQYACCEKLRSMGGRAAVDDYACRDNSFHRAELFRCFDIQGEEIGFFTHWFWKLHIALWARISRQLYGDYRKIPGYYMEDRHRGCEIQELRNSRKRYCFGYWQGIAYLEGIEEQLRRTFRFPDLDERNRRYAEQMRNGVAVSVHIRGGDYLDETNQSLFGGICTKEYYRKAISVILERQRDEDVQFFVFTNDLEYAKGMDCFSGREVVYVLGNRGEDAYRDMQLMSMCMHNIIANSSFSFWGAWLNQNPGKTVIAPTRWVNADELEAMCPVDWVRI